MTDPLPGLAPAPLLKSLPHPTLGKLTWDALYNQPAAGEGDTHRERERISAGNEGRGLNHSNGWISPPSSLSLVSIPD